MAFDAQLPTGVRLVPNLIDAEDESSLVARIDAMTWAGGSGHRSQQYGWHLDESTGVPGAPRFLGALPDWVAPLVTRLHVLAPFDYAPDHLIVREFDGQGDQGRQLAANHTVATLVLLGDLPLQLRRRDAPGAWFLTQTRRSLLVLTERFDRDWSRVPCPPLGVGTRILTMSFRRSTIS